MVGKYAIEQWSRLPVEVHVASEFRYADPVIGNDVLCVAITQSGETADTLAAARLAREDGAPLVAITNAVGSAITRTVDGVLHLQTGPEIGMVSTKTLVTTTTVLYLFGLYLGQQRGTLPPDDFEVFLGPF